MQLFVISLALAASIVLAQDIASSEPTNVRVAALWDLDRVADAADWEAAEQKGERLSCRLDATDEAAGRLFEDMRDPPSARSEWADVTLTNELPLWGWHMGEYDQTHHCNFADDDSDGHLNKIGTALQSLGLSPKPVERGGDNVCYNIEHYEVDAVDDEGDSLEPEDQYYKVHGRIHRCTGAHVRFGVNHRGGMIIGQDFQSPRSQARLLWGHEPDERALPKLQRVSDIMTAFWIRNNPNPKKLKYYLLYNIHNRETAALINTVLKNHGLDKVPYWPGVTATMWGDEGPALLGSPLGGSLAFLLVQHKAELGTKHVTEIVIFRDNYPQDVEPSIQMLFKIKDVPEAGIASEQNLRVRSPVPTDGLKNMIRIHNIFQNTSAPGTGSRQVRP